MQVQTAVTDYCSYKQLPLFASVHQLPKLQTLTFDYIIYRSTVVMLF